MKHGLICAFACLVGAFGIAGSAFAAAPEQVSTGETAQLRRTLPLDGTWDVAEGKLTEVPAVFDHKAPVPGLVDMATPAFPEVGVKSKLRQAFWYRRTFEVKGPIPENAVLKIAKAAFGSRVVLNGVVMGEHWPSYTPALFDVRSALREGKNEICIRVGAFLDVIPKNVVWGRDTEKLKAIPGLFDDVELVLSGSPYIVRVQAVPDIDHKTVTVHAWVKQASKGGKLHFTIREAKTGTIAGEGECDLANTTDGGEREVQSQPIAMAQCRLWSPEDPFLYELEVKSSGDDLKTRFGMRSFRFDSASGRAILNGRPYFMRGSNITIYRFFEDSERGDKPWREEWVRRLFHAFHDMHWNCLRYSVGFPPEAWYHIADEEGFLIQDEFPIWHPNAKPFDFDFKFNTPELVLEYSEWMKERWNHPCVVIWDACNETNAPETGEAIQKVRTLDYSNRPWDNSFYPDEGDCFEIHDYHFANPRYKLAYFARESGMPSLAHLNITGNRKKPIILNEYGYLWLNRDGTPTVLTRKLYDTLLGPNSTTAQRRNIYARYMAAETEFWRSHRHCAAVMAFCALSYSRPNGYTSDNWSDVEKLTWDPDFYKYVRDSFAPVGLMIDAWAETYPSGQDRRSSVAVINDLYIPWRGRVRFRVLRDGKTVRETSQPCTVKGLGKIRLNFDVAIPEAPGSYELEAALIAPGAEPVRSVRDFSVPEKR